MDRGERETLREMGRGSSKRKRKKKKQTRKGRQDRM